MQTGLLNNYSLNELLCTQPNKFLIVPDDSIIAEVLLKYHLVHRAPEVIDPSKVQYKSKHVFEPSSFQYH